MNIAITGGIGSGKSFVCRRLGSRGIEVYDCDAAAKRLMATSASLQAALQKLVGPQVYADGILQKPVLARYLLASEAHKQAVNDVVHPAVAADFLQSGLHWLESAILFDSGFDRRIAFDYVICVAAPLDTRILRVTKRDHISRDRALEWINRQLPQEEVMRRSDFIITNDGVQELDPQIENILSIINNHRKK